MPTCEQQHVAALHAAQRLGGECVHVAHPVALIKHQVAPRLCVKGVGDVLSSSSGGGGGSSASRGVSCG
jgi:hypothetical protein